MLASRVWESEGNEKAAWGRPGSRSRCRTQGRLRIELHGRALGRAAGAEHAAVPFFRPEHGLARFAFVEEKTLVGGFVRVSRARTLGTSILIRERCPSYCFSQNSIGA